MGRSDWEDGGIWHARWTCHVRRSCRYWGVEGEKYEAYSGRLWVMGDLKGAGDVGDSE